MRFLHISDLHFGKTMNECQLIREDQPYWKDRFIETAVSTKADAVVIAGDVYDRSSPSAEAVKLLDEMITELAEKDIKIFIVAGNHDSGQKLGFASDILKNSGIYIAGVLSSDNHELTHVTLDDEYGKITFWLVPYIFPSLVNDILGTDFRDYDSAFRALLEKQNIDLSQRNVIVAHQNVTREGNEAERGGSESMVAGVGGIEYTAFEDFEYTALGHIHAAQEVGRRNIRYAGSPLCYHFDESKFPEKGPVLVELKEKGTEADISVIPVKPLHNVRIINNTYEEIIKDILQSGNEHEYLKAVISDRKVTPEISETLRKTAESRSGIMMEIVSSAGMQSASSETVNIGYSGERSVSDLFSDFFSVFNQNCEPDEKDKEIIELIQENLDICDSEDIAGKIIEIAQRQEENA